MFSGIREVNPRAPTKPQNKCVRLKLKYYKLDKSRCQIAVV